MANDRSGTPRPRRATVPAGREEAAAARERGLQRLRERLPAMTELVVGRLRASEPAYRHGGIPPQEPPLWIGRSLELGLAAFRMPPEERAGTLEWPRKIGQRRATQGVPQQALLRAYHIGGQVICDAFTRWTVEENLPAAYAAALVDDAWDVVDRHAVAALGALRIVEGDLPVLQTAGALLDALLNGETDAGAVAIVSRTFALPEHGRYAVIVQRPAEGAPPMDPLELPARVSGARVHWRMQGENAIGVVALGDLASAALGAGLPVRGGRRTGVSVAVQGLADLGRARQFADLATRTLPNGQGLAALDDRLPATMLTIRPDLARELETRVLAPVLELEPVARDLLLNTLSAWLEAEGSATRAAEALYCHRNTVLNRLKRLELLTGRSLDHPRDLVELTLALEAFDIRSGTER